MSKSGKKDKAKKPIVDKTVKVEQLVKSKAEKHAKRLSRFADRRAKDNKLMTAYEERKAKKERLKDDSSRSIIRTQKEIKEHNRSKHKSNQGQTYG